MGCESLAHAAGALQTQLLGTLEITNRGPSRKALMQTLHVLTDLSVECREVLSSGKVPQFSQRQPALEATQAQSDDPLLMLKLRHARFCRFLIGNLRGSRVETRP